jgi:transketolase
VDAGHGIVVISKPRSVNRMIRTGMAGTGPDGVNGKIPFAASFACFLTRDADFLRMAGHSRPPHLVICGSHAGVSIGEDGPSQMASRIWRCFAPCSTVRCSIPATL